MSIRFAIQVKTCSKCGHDKALEDFARDSRARDGRHAGCKDCQRGYFATYYDGKREQVLDQAERYRNRPEVKEQRAGYRLSNQKRLRKQQVEYREVNPHKMWETDYRKRARRFGFTPVVESFTRDELTARHGDVCVDCGDPWGELEHVVPVSEGGEHTLNNCVPICHLDNHRRWVEWLAARAGRGEDDDQVLSTSR